MEIEEEEKEKEKEKKIQIEKTVGFKIRKASEIFGKHSVVFDNSYDILKNTSPKTDFFMGKLNEWGITTLLEVQGILEFFLISWIFFDQFKLIFATIEKNEKFLFSLPRIAILSFKLIYSCFQIYRSNNSLNASYEELFIDLLFPDKTLNVKTKERYFRKRKYLYSIFKEQQQMNNEKEENFIDEYFGDYEIYLKLNEKNLKLFEKKTKTIEDEEVSYAQKLNQEVLFITLREKFDFEK